ncbi:MAG: sugar MFS transporter [Bacteroidales bacterium]|nr:sugar MFS transporter [Bacteroidales bacterium]
MKQTNRQFILSMVMLGALFFIFGLVSWVNSILVPYFKVACELQTDVQSYLVTFAFYIAYLVMTIPASFLLTKVGFKKGVEYGLWILALGALLFMPAALTRSYAMFLAALFTMGTALAILQTAANPFVTIIGPRESAARRISIMGICNKFAGVVSPLIFAAAVIRPQDKITMDAVQAGELVGAAKEQALDAMIQGVILPYVILAVVLFVFGIVFYKSSIPDIDPNKDNKSEGDSGTDRKSILCYPYLVLGVLALFAHTGSQQISIATIIDYAGSMGIDMLEAKVFPSFTLACIMIGYMSGIICIPRYLSQQKALVVCTVTGLILSFLVLLTQNVWVDWLGMNAKLSIWFLVILGIPNSLIYAGIWPLAIKNLGRWTNLGSSILVMALCGNAVMTLSYGALADKVGLDKAYWLLIPCFAYMIYYALWGYKVEHWTKK